MHNPNVSYFPIDLHSRTSRPIPTTAGPQPGHFAFTNVSDLDMTNTLPFCLLSVGATIPANSPSVRLLLVGLLRDFTLNCLLAAHRVGYMYKYLLYAN